MWRAIHGPPRLGYGRSPPHISEGLGHTSERTTRIYLASLDRQTVDEVNERVTKL